MLSYGKERRAQGGEQIIRSREYEGIHVLISCHHLLCGGELRNIDVINRGTAQAAMWFTNDVYLNTDMHSQDQRDIRRTHQVWCIQDFLFVDIRHHYQI